MRFQILRSGGEPVATANLIRNVYFASGKNCSAGISQ